jgi:hypothetical protein
LRPKLIIRKIDIHSGTRISTIGVPDADPWRVDFEAVNVGQGTAHVSAYSFAISLVDSELPTGISYMEDDEKPFSLQPGQELMRSINIDEKLTNILRLVGPDGLRLGYQNTNRIYFVGNARYADDLGIERNVSVCRHYQNSRFVPVDDPDREYSD